MGRSRSKGGFHSKDSLIRVGVIKKNDASTQPRRGGTATTDDNHHDHDDSGDDDADDGHDAHDDDKS